MYQDLQQFIAALEEMGELVRITEPVSPVLEIAAITNLICKAQAPGEPSTAAKNADPENWDRGGPAILFENVEGSDVPLLINAFGSYRRVEMALGCKCQSLDEIRERIEQARMDGVRLRPRPDPGFPDRCGGIEAVAEKIGCLLKPEPPKSFRDAISMARRFAPLLKVGPKRKKKPGACQQRVQRANDIDLTKLPFIRCWPQDGDFASMGYPEGVNDNIPGLGHPDVNSKTWDDQYRGRYITLAGIHTVHADDADNPKPPSHNIGMYRVQLMGKDQLAMHWHVHHDGASHWRSWKKLGKPMPVAIVLGGPSVLPYSATAPLPPGISELLLAGFLNKKGIKLCPGVSVPLWVPSDAEIVIEGYVRTDAGEVDFDPHTQELGEGAVFEGPFGDHTGFYSLPDRYPIVEVSAVTMREKPVFPATIVGAPPQEDYFLGKATERIFLPMLKTLIHDIEDYDLPMFGAFHNCAFLQIKKAYPLQARRVMHAVWGAGQMAWTKTIFVVDESVDVHDWRAVVRAAAEHCDPSCDVEIVRGPLDILDHAAPWLGAGGKMGFDCTPKWDGEEPRKHAKPTTNRVFTGQGEIAARVSRIEGVTAGAMPESLCGWLFVSTESRGQEEVSAIAERVLDAADMTEHEPPGYVVFLGEDVDVANDASAMFHWVANADMLRDAHVSGRTMWFDSTPKEPSGYEDVPARQWPTYLEMDQAVEARVKEKWASYGFPSGLYSAAKLWD
jgi:4-hydroxy-3-polyprenylbenzoate decarboxylase